VQGGQGGRPPRQPQRGASQPTMIRSLSGVAVIKIGRALDNDVVVNDLQASALHAELKALPTGASRSTDLASHNKTYVNGQQIDRQIIGPEDAIGIGHTSFRLVGNNAAGVRGHRRGLLLRPGLNVIVRQGADGRSSTRSASASTPSRWWPSSARPGPASRR